MGFFAPGADIAFLIAKSDNFKSTLPMSAIGPKIHQKVQKNEKYYPMSATKIKIILEIQMMPKNIGQYRQFKLNQFCMPK